MHPYIEIHQKELLDSDMLTYKFYSNTLRKALQKTCGWKSILYLNHDLTFLLILYMGLYDRQVADEKKIDLNLSVEVIDYVADLCIILTNQSLFMEDVTKRSVTKKILSQALKAEYELRKGKYPRQEKALQEYKLLMQCAQNSEEKNLDVIAGYSGELLSEILVWKEDELEQELRNLGYHMGKFIYLLHSYEQIAKDKANKKFNPLSVLGNEKEEDIDTFSKLLLTSMAQECQKSFERLGVEKNKEILHHIFYSGIWQKYDGIVSKRKKSAEKKVLHHPI